MREIKFRLRDRHNKIVGYEKWYPGSFNSEQRYWKAVPCWLYSEGSQYWNPTPIGHSQKDQYTGLKDKNSKEIYESDICKAIFYENESTIFTIEWIHSGFRICDRPHSGYPLDIHGLHSIEIIGNIYENPELVNGNPDSISEA